MIEKLQPPPLPEQYLTSDEVSDLLRVPRNTLATWRYRRTGPRYIRMGRHVRYLASDVQTYLEEHTVSTDAHR